MSSIRISVLVSILVATLLGAAEAKPGTVCVACTVLVSSLANSVRFHGREWVDKEAKEYCSKHSIKILRPFCEQILEKAGNEIIYLLEKRASPDDICQNYNYCKNPKCKAFPDWPKAGAQHVEALLADYAKTSARHTPISIPDEPMAFDGVDHHQMLLEVNQNIRSSWIDDLIHYLEKIIIKLNPGLKDGLERVVQEHLPFSDEDGDRFSTMERLRGTHWRGRDCNDHNAEVRPGRAALNGDMEFDSNCNGIFGQDKDGKSYEEDLCANSGARGLIVLGDSAAAHFHIDPTIIDPTRFGPKILAELIPQAEDELDFPYCGAYTGFETDPSKCPPGDDTPDSLYLRLKKQNRCNHRDYQNIGINGADSKLVADKYIQSMARNQTSDNPALVIHAVIGNDICESKPGVEYMTTPEVFREKVLKSMAILDDTLPKDSHVVFIGLVDGDALYRTLANLQHPIGATYADVYDFLICTEATPCAGWMTSDADARAATKGRMEELNAVYAQIVKGACLPHQSPCGRVSVCVCVVPCLCPGLQWCGI
eukprot:GFYU01007265.1.p1 GENE.GFYU01007265.1~~GFYU01007265.1.p1  ORF type:complete len:539 (-),score=142.02 GFYU01007265.1:238-1854(-)